MSLHLGISEAEKKSKILGLSDEVKDFHPVLHSLFKKLPGIDQVHYTHGQWEKGADFILTMTDNILKDSNCVAVIVKSGKIDKNIQQSGLADQIKESSMERLVGSGRIKLKPNVLWIITNDVITQQARESLHNLLNGTNCKILSNPDIVRLIDENMRDYWTDVPAELWAYLRDLDATIKETERSLSLINGADCDIYIEQAMRSVRPEYESRAQKLRADKKYINVHELSCKHKFTFIQGEAGYGKSKLLRQLARMHCNPIFYNRDKIVPIFCSAGSLKRDKDGVLSLLIKDAIGSLPKGIISDDVRLLILIDGFDELKIDEEEKVSLVTKLSSEVKGLSNSHVVITSRPINLVERMRGFNNEISLYELMPLSIKNMVSFFSSLCKKSVTSTRFIEDIKSSSIFKQLPKSPIAAILLAKLIEDNSKDLPSNLSELYQKYCELMLGRWDMQRGLQSQKEYDAASAIVNNMAIYFLDNSLEDIAESEAFGFFTEYLGKRNLGISPEDLFKKVTARSGIILYDEGSGKIRFKHRTFSEFFYARSKLKTANPASFIEPAAFHPYFKNIYFFYVGLQRDCPEVLAALMNLKPGTASEQYMKCLLMADYFLAGYMTEYDFIKKSFEQLIKELAILYSRILRGEEDLGEFQNMPEIMVLWTFQMLIRHCYGYDYFANALPEASIGIVLDESLTEEQKQYACFFISLIGVQLKVRNPLDGLLDSFGNSLSMPIQFGIRYELKNIKTHSHLLNAQTRKLERFLRNGDEKIVKNILDILHATPLAEALKLRLKNKERSGISGKLRPVPK